MKIKFLLFGLKILRILISVYTLSLTAKLFGVSVARDNWIVAYSIFIVIDLAFWGPINETFRSKFVELESKLGFENALKGVSSLMKFVNVITFILFLLFYFSSNYISKFLLPKGSISEVYQLTLIIKLISPTLLLNQANLLMSSILNGLNVFYIPEITGVIAASINIIILLIFQPHFGIYSLVISHYCNLICLFVLLLHQFNKRNIKLFNFSYEYNFRDVKPYLIFALPFFLPFFFGQLGSISEKYISNLIGVGTASNIDYSKKFNDIPINIITSMMTAIYVPIITKYFYNNNFEKVKSELNSNLKFGFLIIFLFSSINIFWSDEIVFYLFDKGNISVENLKTINIILQLYSFSSCAVFLYILGGLTLISTNQSKTYAYVGVFAQILIVILNFSLYSNFGIYVFPFSFFVVHFLAAVLMIYKINNLVKVIFNILYVTLLFFGTLLVLLIIKLLLINYDFNFVIKSATYFFFLGPLLIFFYKNEVKLIYFKLKNLI